MFTGLVEETGTLSRKERRSNSARLLIKARKVIKDLKIGDSIAVNGVCLTVTDFGAGGFAADVMPETMRKTNLGELRVEEQVNLERAIRAGERFGGHFVSGHIDARVAVLKREREANAILFRFELPEEYSPLVVPRGSVALDGISLTVASCSPGAFEVAIVPHTLDRTTLEQKGPGDLLNLEVDMIGRYVASILSAGERGNAQVEDKGPGVDYRFLAERGFLS